MINIFAIPPMCSTSRRHTLVTVLAVVTVLLSTHGARAQQPRAPISFAYTYHVFQYNDTASVLEFVYGFSDAGLSYTGRSEDGKAVGKLYLRLRLRNTGADRDPMDYEWVVVHPMPTETDRAEGKMLVGIQNFAVKPGNYSGQVLLRDMFDPKRQDSSEFSVTVPAFTGRRVMISDVEIASELQPSDDDADRFAKLGYHVVPSLNSMIAPPDMMLRTYTEVYNADGIPADRFGISFVIADSSGRAVYQKDDTRPRPKSTATAQVDSFPMKMLPTGQYYFIAKIFNAPRRAATDSMKVVRVFRVLNSDVDDSLRQAARQRDEAAAAGNALVDPLYAGQSEKELDERYAELKHIITEPEKRIWNGLSGVQPKGLFMTRFWAHRDPTPDTPLNEERESYNKRLRSAATLYVSPQSPRGWDSDRGRILLQYGTPDAIDRHPQDLNRKPYEVWTYNSKNYVFYFIDRPQTGNYTLVNSTAPLERQNDNWEEIAKLDPHSN